MPEESARQVALRGAASWATVHTSVSVVPAEVKEAAKEKISTSPPPGSRAKPNYLVVADCNQGYKTVLDSSDWLYPQKVQQ